TPTNTPAGGGGGETLTPTNTPAAAGATATPTSGVGPGAGAATSTPVREVLPSVGTRVPTPGAKPTPSKVLPITGQVLANLVPVLVLVWLAGIIFLMGLYMRRRRARRDL